MEWILETVFELASADIIKLFHSLTSNYRFCFEDWAALQGALIDYQENKHVDLSDCLIARKANSQGADTLYTFEGRSRLGALSIVTTLEP